MPIEQNRQPYTVVDSLVYSTGQAASVAFLVKLDSTPNQLHTKLFHAAHTSGREVSSYLSAPLFARFNLSYTLMP